MTPEAIDTLAQRAQTGDSRAATDLVKALQPYKGYVHRLAAALQVDTDETLSVLGLAITLALKGWDPERGHFATWMVWQVRGALKGYRQTPPMESWEELVLEQDAATAQETEDEKSPDTELARQILQQTPEYLEPWLRVRILEDCSRQQAAEIFDLSQREAIEMDRRLRQYFQRWQKERALA
jgi:hypothetical protein